VLAAGGWFARKTVRAQAKRQVAQVAALAEAGNYADAYDLAVAVQRYVPGSDDRAVMRPSPTRSP
jgi:hypothetical protein